MSSLFQFRQNVHFTPKLDFGCAVIRSVDQPELKRRVTADKIAAMEAVKAGRDRLEDAVGQYSALFEANGFKNPLAHQLTSVLKKGFPTINPFVDALLIAEMTTGHLMGVQDWAKVRGELFYDRAVEGDVFAGMRGRVECRAGEMVLRDDAGIIASYFQGPDNRTKVGNGSKDVVFFVFSAPGIDRTSIEAALQCVVDLCDPGGTTSEMVVRSPE